MSIDAGKLNHRITIQRAVESQSSASGAVEHSWLTVATVWASIRPLNAREFIQASAAQMENTVQFQMRYMAGISSQTHRILALNKVYDIRAVLDEDELNDSLTIMCAQGANNG